MRMRTRRAHVPGEMNKLEQKYAQHLEQRRLAGEIASWRFEEMKFKLAKATFFTPDFWVVMPDGSVELHETKGFWEEDARIKIKVAADKFHEFLFCGLTWNKRDGWKEERFGA